MAKLKGSVVEKILKKAGGVFGDKGFIGTDYITTPIRKPECRELLQWEHEWNSQVSSFRAPVERAVATLKTWRILFTDYRRPLKTFKSSFRAAMGTLLLQGEFCITSMCGHCAPRKSPSRRPPADVPDNRPLSDGRLGRPGPLNRKQFRMGHGALGWWMPMSRPPAVTIMLPRRATTHDDLGRSTGRASGVPSASRHTRTEPSPPAITGLLSRSTPDGHRPVGAASWRGSWGRRWCRRPEQPGLSRACQAGFTAPRHWRPRVHQCPGAS